MFVTLEWGGPHVPCAPGGEAHGEFLLPECPSLGKNRSRGQNGKQGRCDEHEN
jgi:hypothetical protein